jgi:Tfp pilus assembly protein FimT
VIAIVGVIAGIAMPRYSSSMWQYRVTAAARRLQADLKLARDQAIHQSQSLTVTFVSKFVYQIAGVSDLNRSSQMPYTVDLSDDPYRAAVTLLVVGGDNQIVFDGYGIPDTACSFTVSAGSFSRIVQIDAMTGEIQVTTP